MELQHDRELWEALLDVTHVAAGSTDARELSNTIVQRLISRGTIVAGGVWLRDGDELIALARHGFERPPSPVQIYRVVESGMPAFIESADAEQQDGMQLARLLAFLPLRAGQERIGAIVLLGAAPHPAERALFEAIAAHLSLAFQSLRGAHKAQATTRTAPSEHDWDAFLAHAAHEIKNPLASIKGYADLLVRRATNDPADPYRKGLTIVSQQVGRTTSLLEQLSDMSRVGSGRLRLDRHTSDLAETVRRAVAAQQASTDQHKIRVEGADEALPAVYDIERLGQVLGALLSNAIKFMPDGGAIDVRLERTSNSQATIMVRDHGIGVPAGEEEQVFDRFFRGSNVAGAYRGLGIGLFVARGIVERHGGRIWLEQAPNGGTISRVEVPLGAPVIPQ